MRPDDIFLARLQLTITTLRYWTPSIADAAAIEESESASHWRMRISPRLPEACPFELILRADQFYDIAVAGEEYDARPITSLDLFSPLVEAIAAGAVFQRRWASAATGAPRAVETIILLGAGRAWRGAPASLSSPETLEGAESADHYFLPYRR